MIIGGKDYESVLFVHIPKTAGSSISKILYDNNLDNWNRGWPRHHDPYFYLKENNNIDNTVFSFSVVRNPYRRTYSCFNQYNRVNKIKLSFIEYLKNIKDGIVSPTTPLLHLPQSFYIIKNNKIQINKVYKFENLNEFESDFGWKLGFYNRGDYMIQSYINDYTEEAIKITKELYAEDFANFEYSLDFEDFWRDK